MPRCFNNGGLGFWHGESSDSRFGALKGCVFVHGMVELWTHKASWG